MPQQVKNPPAMQETQETWVQSPGQEDPLEEETATHSSLEDSMDRGARGLQSMRLQRVRHE